MMIPQRKYDLIQIEERMARGEWEDWYSNIVNRAPTFSEAFFAYLFDSLDIDYKCEYVIGRYPLDFFIPHVNLCIDVDSPCFRSKGGRKSKKKKGDIKEQYVRNLGYEFFRLGWVRYALTFNKDITEERIDLLLDTIQRLEKTEHNTKE